MTVYKVAGRSPNQLAFRIFSFTVILLMLGLLVFSRYEPQGISDLAGHTIAWAGIVILFVSIIVATMLSAKEGIGDSSNQPKSN